MADSHKVANPVSWKHRRGVGNYGPLHRGRLADAHPADGEAIERLRRNERRGLLPQILVNSALDNAEYRLASSSRLQATKGPLVRPSHRNFGFLTCAWVWRALVERHCHVHAE